jgi:hypothetical protein
MEPVPSVEPSMFGVCCVHSVRTKCHRAYIKKVSIVGGESSHYSWHMLSVNWQLDRTFTTTRVRGSRYHSDPWRDCSRDEESALLPTGSWLVENTLHMATEWGMATTACRDMNTILRLLLRWKSDYSIPFSPTFGMEIRSRNVRCPISHDAQPLMTLFTLVLPALPRKPRIKHRLSICMRKVSSGLPAFD